ncbi:MAG: aminopeptidase N [Gammaproteobacteria bacterium RIFCSPHIGHO2_12_FULL_37_14]|nr:MAG: aminopeptidase N [Gammaproteobacteria bacterium RIFCSPHIGHO2_12_FULL_37_14]
MKIASTSPQQSTYLKNYTPANYFIDEINLNVDLYEEHTIVTTLMKLRHNRVHVNQEKTLILDGEELILQSIKLNQDLLNNHQYQLVDNHLIIPHLPDHFTLEITTKIFPDKNTALSGLYRSQKTYCTQCEAEGFRRITYYLDRPDVLARFTTTITADAAHYPILLSNGNLIASGKLDNHRHWVKWQDPFKKPCYLFALVAGDFDMIEDVFTTQSKREISLRIYVEKGYGNQAYHAMYSLKEAMRWDEITYGREYDLDIYMIVAISDFNMGAMENKGLNIFNTKYILAKPETATDDDYINISSVISHEYFHNWSGNRVTCRDWFQLSLKEGLTIFRDQTFSEDLFSAAVMRIHDVCDLREIQFPEDAGPLAHPVRPDSYIEINNFYTATVYNKGAEVLRMLRTILGFSLFRKGMDVYFARYDGQATTIDDYIAIMEDVSGLDLAQFKLWYSQAGTPVILVEEDFNEIEKSYTLSFMQTCPPTPGQPTKLPLYIPIRIKLLDQQGKTIPLQLQDNITEDEKVLPLTSSHQSFKFQNINSVPIPSLLRNFSAPVKLNYAYSDKDLLFLLKHDDDAFNRWEAGQKYLLRITLNLLRNYHQEVNLILPSALLEVFEYMIKSYRDKWLLSEMLVIPSEKYIGEQMDEIDIDGIHTVREFMITEIANQLYPLWLSTYHDNHDSKGNYRFEIEEVGRRQLKNNCLAYLMRLPPSIQLGMQQFETSLELNMTDTQAALSALANTDSPLRKKALSRFYDCWKQDALVMDKWFAIQAASKLPSALSEVKKLMRDSTFDIKNPNKVYALIGTFGNRNLINFHSITGESYAFLRDVVQQLDRLNPQIAARMVKPLTTWKRYDKERQQLMREQLELLLRHKEISADLYEVTFKALEYEI